ncbi:hypothetical protein HRG_001056 [Hirsutella rhossiliensis]|uniref:Uncharacterized protein n=1 Tax=Hirsutella rhossiliensis TaxID=111463 RepID=A0A9P8N9X2_9HYPO|nr:uncharacterized protein HRG_01056 [Hirsutella rhossiliensis]KAH0968414.1 hypothetical protein HRG_01056 [Hirsutella rhossiliensis]
MEASGHELYGSGEGSNEESWKQYITQHGFEDAWDDSNHRTEQDRYGPILARLAASHESRMAAQEEIVREKERWSLLMRRSADRLEPHTAKVQEIMDLADAVQLEWAEKKALDDRHARREAEWWPRVFSPKRVRIGDWADEDTKEMAVSSTLFDPRYYLGHQGGDYIFQYRDEDDTNDLEATVPTDKGPEMAWEPWRHPGWHSILAYGPEDLPKRLTYCGQVPRPVKEYTARLQVLVPAIAKMIVSLVGFHRAGGNDEPLGQQLRELAALDSTSSRADLGRLLELWTNEFAEKDGRAPDEMRERLRRSAKVSEFVHVLGKVAAIGAETLLHEWMAVVLVLEKSTGWRLCEMLEIEYIRIARRAFHELLHKKDFEHLLVLEVPGTEYIHEFYLAPRFRSDPLHPSRRYACRDVSAQLELSQWLRQFGWAKDEPELETARHSDPEETVPQDFEDDSEDSCTDDPDDKDYTYCEDKNEIEVERLAKRARTSCPAAGNHAVPKNGVAERAPRSLPEPQSADEAENQTSGPKRKKSLANSDNGRSPPKRQPLQPVNGTPSILERKQPKRAKVSAGGAKSAPTKDASSKRRKGQAMRSENHARIKVLKQNMFSPAPPPLRMARLRYLRHWTIHRAWQLFRRQQHEALDKERSRMHAGMFNACEELRKTGGPGNRGEGYLYRVAMEKKGIYGLNGVPIEYARFQTDSPAKNAWNHEWKR